MEKTEKKRVLVVEDDEDVKAELKATLAKYEAKAAPATR